MGICLPVVVGVGLKRELLLRQGHAYLNSSGGKRRMSCRLCSLMRCEGKGWEGVQEEEIRGQRSELAHLEAEGILCPLHCVT